MRQTTLTVSVVTIDENEQPIRMFNEFVQSLDKKYRTVYIGIRGREVMEIDGAGDKPHIVPVSA